MTISKKLLGAVAVVAGLVSASAAHAIAFTQGSFAISIPGGTSTSGNVATLTSYTLNLFAGNSMYAITPTGDFASCGGCASGVPISTSTAINFVAGTGFNWSSAPLGSFAASSASDLGVITNGLSVTHSFRVDGTYTVGTAFTNSGSNFSAAETWAFTQTGGVLQSISVNATYFSPAQVPEPASLLLLGSGLLAAGFGARRKAKKA